jgi:hypothetical protein
MRRIYTEGTIDPKIGEPFRELYHHTTNEKVLVTNAELAYGEYIYKVTDTTLFDAAFVSALGYRLGADLAIPLTGDKARAEGLIMLFNNKASEGNRLNSYEEQDSAKQSSSFLNAR